MISVIDEMTEVILFWRGETGVSPVDSASNEAVPRRSMSARFQY